MNVIEAIRIIEKWNKQKEKEIVSNPNSLFAVIDVFKPLDDICMGHIMEAKCNKENKKEMEHLRAVKDFFITEGFKVNFFSEEFYTVANQKSVKTQSVIVSLPKKPKTEITIAMSVISSAISKSKITY